MQNAKYKRYIIIYKNNFKATVCGRSCIMLQTGSGINVWYSDIATILTLTDHFILHSSFKTFRMLIY